MTLAATERVRRSLCLLPLGLAACAAPGQVTLSGLDDFGELRSAVWLVEADALSTAHRLILSNREGVCSAWKDAAAILASLDASSHDDCELFQVEMALVGEALGGVVGDGAIELDLTLDDAPAEGTWSTADPDGEDAEHVFAGRTSLYRENRYAWAATEYDCGDPDPVSDYTADLLDDYALTSARLTLSAVGSRALEGTLEGVIADDHDGDLLEAGALSAEARWTRCEVDAYEDPMLDEG